MTPSAIAPAWAQKCDRSADGRLDHEEIEVFCRELLRRPELDAVFIQYSANGCVLSTLDLRDFLLDQGEDASLVHAQSLILTYELNEWGTHPCFSYTTWSNKGAKLLSKLAIKT